MNRSVLKTKPVLITQTKLQDQFTVVLSLPTFWIIQSAKQIIEIRRDKSEETDPLSCIQGWFTVQDSGFDDCTAK